MTVTIDEIDLVRNQFGFCFWDYLVLFDSLTGQGNVPDLLGERMCGSTPPTNALTATGNIVHVWYQSRHEDSRGFSLLFSANV